MEVREDLKECRKCGSVMKVKYKEFQLYSYSKLHHIKYECTCGTQCYINKNGEFWEGFNSKFSETIGE